MVLLAHAGAPALIWHAIRRRRAGWRAILIAQPAIKGEAEAAMPPDGFIAKPSTGHTGKHLRALAAAGNSVPSGLFDPGAASTVRHHRGKSIVGLVEVFRQRCQAASQHKPPPRCWRRQWPYRGGGAWRRMAQPADALPNLMHWHAQASTSRKTSPPVRWAKR
jgi:hypothetical protein